MKVSIKLSGKKNKKIKNLPPHNTFCESVLQKPHATPTYALFHDLSQQTVLASHLKELCNMLSF